MFEEHIILLFFTLDSIDSPFAITHLQILLSVLTGQWEFLLLFLNLKIEQPVKEISQLNQIINTDVDTRKYKLAYFILELKRKILFQCWVLFLVGTYFIPSF